MGHLVQGHQASHRRAARLVALARSSAAYRAVAQTERERIREKVREIALARPRFGGRRITWVLQKEHGMRVNHKRVERICREERLQVRRRRRRKLCRLPRLAAPAERRHERWCLDFIEDTTVRARRFRCLTVLEQWSRYLLELFVATSIPAARVCAVLEQLVDEHGAPEEIVVDNGPEFVARALVELCAKHKIRLSHIEPGKPQQNGYVESFHGRWRDEYLNPEIFLDLRDARRKQVRNRHEYNHHRPHSSLGNRTPAEVFYARHAGGRGSNAAPSPCTPSTAPAVIGLNGDDVLATSLPLINEPFGLQTGGSL